VVEGEENQYVLVHFCQSKVPSCVESTAVDMHSYFTMSASDSRWKPVVVLEKMDLAR